MAGLISARLTTDARVFVRLYLTKFILHRLFIHSPMNYLVYIALHAAPEWDSLSHQPPRLGYPIPLCRLGAQSD